jgi:hypothetical protein
MARGRFAFPGRPAAFAAAVLLLAVASPASADPEKEPAYPLDDISRTVPSRGVMRCPRVALTDHRVLMALRIRRFLPPAS